MLGTLLVTIIIAGVVWWFIDWASFIPPTFKTLAKIVLIIGVCMYLAKATGIVAWLNSLV